MTLVIDASVALTWCFDDEKREATDAIGRRIVAEGAHAPSLFPLELANILLAAERRGRLAAPEVSQRLANISLMPIFIDDQTPSRAWEETLRLARAERLTSYDASYLELALRLGVQLATLDADLATAARHLGVDVLP